MSNKLFINCDEATLLCTKNQYKEASFFEKIQLNIHMMRCKVCGLYSKQNTKLSEMCDAHLDKFEQSAKLSDADKEALKKKLTEVDK